VFGSISLEKGNFNQKERKIKNPDGIISLPWKY